MRKIIGHTLIAIIGSVLIVGICSMVYLLSYYRKVTS